MLIECYVDWFHLQHLLAVDDSYLGHLWTQNPNRT
jgi:hypothetical protein